MFSSGSPFVNSLNGVLSDAVEEGTKETETEVGLMVEGGSEV
jgi:hypothetical protein